MWEEMGSERDIMEEESARGLLLGNGTATALLDLTRRGVMLFRVAALAVAGVGLPWTWPRRFASVPEGGEANVGIGRSGLRAGAGSRSRKGSKALLDAACLGRGCMGSDLRLVLRILAVWGAASACGGEG
jgi:hypothetical protein